LISSQDGNHTKQERSERARYCYKLPVSDFIDGSILTFFVDLLTQVGNIPTCIIEPLEKSPLCSTVPPAIPRMCQEHTYCLESSCKAFFIEAIKKSTFERPYQCSCPGNLHCIINPLVLNQGASTGALVSGCFLITETEQDLSSPAQPPEGGRLYDEQLPTISKRKLRCFAELHKMTAEYIMQYGAMHNSRYDDSFMKNLSVARQTLNTTIDDLTQEMHAQKSKEWEKERELIDLITLGKNKEADEKVIELTHYLATMYKQRPQEFKGRVMELAVVMTRTPYFSSYSEVSPINIRVPEFYPPMGYDPTELCQWLQRILQNVMDNAEPLMYGNDAASIARMAIGYIDTHIHSIIRLEEVSQEMGFSLRHLNRIFLEEIGISVSEYFVRIKIQEAKRLLQHSQLTIAEIAEQLNYWDSTHFAKMFRKITGKSPREFRQEQQSYR